MRENVAGKLFTRLAWLAVPATVLAAVLLLSPAPPGASAVPDLEPEEQAFVELIDGYRQQNGLAALSIDPQLQEAARWMSTDMGTHNYFSHTDSLGRDPFQRMADFGYSYNTWLGENLAAGASSAQQAFDLWRNSPGHNANMLGANYRVMGIALVYTTGSDYGWYWTNDFGGYEAPSPTATPSPAVTSSPSPAVTPSPTASTTPSPPPAATPSPSPSPSPTPFLTPSPTPLVTPSPAAATTPAATAALGDVDCDGRVDARDALALLRRLAGMPASESCEGSADVDCDGLTGVRDALAILRQAAHLSASAEPLCS